MLNHHSSKQQASKKRQTVQLADVTEVDIKVSTSQIKDKNQLSRVKVAALGDWDGRVVAADPDPGMMTNPNYWNAYCQGIYQRYLKKYGINQVDRV